MYIYACVYVFVHLCVYTRVYVYVNAYLCIEREREIMLFIGKPMGRSIMISNVFVHRLWVLVSVFQRVDCVMHAHVFSCAYACVYICV